jgi:hypothetical protein
MRSIRILLALFVVATLSTVAEAATLEILPSASEARYRVKEQLMGFNFPNDAVGTTQRVSGTIAFSVQGRRSPWTSEPLRATRPRIFRVLSIEDHIRLEVDLALRQAS